MGNIASHTYEVLESYYYGAEGAFGELPDKVLASILLKMDGMEVARAAGVCSHWAHFLETNQDVWRDLFFRDFKHRDLVRASGKSWREAYIFEYKRRLEMFRKNTAKIAEIAGYAPFNPNSKASYDGLVAHLNEKLNTNIEQLNQPGLCGMDISGT